MFLLNGNILNLDTPFVIGDTTYPSNWLRLTSIEEKNAVGITEAPDPESYDSRFYVASGVYRELEELRLQYLAHIKPTMAEMLRRTDWAIVRKMEIGQDVPEKIAAFRSQARQEAERLTSAIMQVQSVAELITVIDSQQWPALD